MQPVDTKVYTSLVRMEYKKVFDNFVSKYAEGIGYNLEEAGTSIEYNEILKRRKDLIVQGYFKYGSVYDNYVKTLRMKPFEDAKRRVQAYGKTHNTAHLIDALNFMMLGYFVRLQYVPDTFQEIEVFSQMFDLALDWDVTDAVIFYMDMYVEHNELEYLGLIALLIIYELQHPTFPDINYNADHETIAISGYSIKDMKE